MNLTDSNRMGGLLRNQKKQMRIAKRGLMRNNRDSYSEIFLGKLNAIQRQRFSKNILQFEMELHEKSVSKLLKECKIVLEKD